MPVSLLNTDTSFPSFENDTLVKERVEVLTDYLYMLLEELRYTFGNLGEENFNDAGLESLSMKVAEPINIRVQKTEDSLAKIEILAEKNNTFISQMVSSIGEDGTVTAASIVAAINDAGSSVKIKADHVEISGFVTFESLEKDGGSTINGNNVSLILDASGDDGYTNLTSNASLNFMYKKSSGTDLFMANLFTTVDGSDTDISSRYALHISTYQFRNNSNVTVYPAIKMSAAGRISIESNSGLYIASQKSDGYIILDAWDNTRIVASSGFDNMRTAINDLTYSFCLDGIYFGGKRLIAT